MSALLHLLLGVGACAALGTLVDRLLLLLEPSAARWPVRVLLGVVTVYVALGLPVFGALAFVMLLALRSRREPRLTTVPLPTRVALVVVLVVVVLVALRPPVAMYWDEYVWLAKARLGAPDPRALVGEALTPGTNVVPIAYPLFHPLAVASLAGLSSLPSAVVLGAEALTVCVASAFALTAAESASGGQARRALGLAAALGAAPLVLVHLRSAYVDLETGMLAATIALLLDRKQPRSAAVLAVALVGLKDEGLAHVIAITAAWAFMTWRAERRLSRDVLSVLAFAFGSFAAWHVRILMSGVGQPDHTLGLPRLDRVPLVVSLLFRQATDLVSWGPLWIVLAALLLASALRFVVLDGDARTRLGALALQASFLLGAIVAGSDRVAAFAESGTLLPRLLVQLVPMAVLLLSAALTAPRGAPPRSPGSPTPS